MRWARWGLSLCGSVHGSVDPIGVLGSFVPLLWSWPLAAVARPAVPGLWAALALAASPVVAYIFASAYIESQ